MFGDKIRRSPPAIYETLYLPGSSIRDLVSFLPHFCDRPSGLKDHRDRNHLGNQSINQFWSRLEVAGDGSEIRKKTTCYL